MDKYSSIRKACEINDLVFDEIVADFHFKTEKEIASFILKRFRLLGVRSAFPPIVANNNQRIHPKPRKKKLERGFLILDFGCKVNGYCSDMTRTLFLGKPSAYEKRLYNLVLRCQKRSIARIKIGASYKQLDADARKDLGGYKKYFVHSLGHGMGKKIHMKPRVSRKSEEYAKRGDCITIEPGVYWKRGEKRFGIRIEDTCYVGKKIEVLTKARKDFICLHLRNL